MASCAKNCVPEPATGLGTLEEAVERANTLFAGLEEAAGDFLLGLVDVSQHLTEKALATGNHHYTDQVTEVVNLSWQMGAEFWTVCLWLDAMPTK